MIDIRRYSGVCGAAVIGAIVVGAHAMRKLGNVHETRVLATGKSADAMQEWIRVAGLAPLIGEQVYSERASALGPR